MNFMESLKKDWDIEGKSFQGKLCPLRQKEINSKNYFGPCYGEKCGLWDSSKERCGISAIAITV
jgi:hypothetical protein